MDRRTFLTGTFSVAALAPAEADDFVPPALRGSIDANVYGLVANAPGDQGRILQRLLDQASAEDRTLLVPPGRYVVSNIVLPKRARIAGIEGATHLAFSGDGHFIMGESLECAHLTGIAFDGGHKPLPDYVPAVVQIADTPDVQVVNCAVTASAGIGLALDRCGGRINHTLVADAAEAGIRAIESTGFIIGGNTVRDCGNGGILVWRWAAGEDGTIVAGNRVERIRADGGGTGANGNGINVFRAHGVTVADNRVSDCAFSAIRANAASNVSITGNSTARSGEVGIYAEFAFEGAVIANNIVAGAETGISVTNFNDGGRLAVVSGNIIRDLTGAGAEATETARRGVGIAVEADASVTGNVIDGAPFAGIVLGWGPYLRDVAATSNVIRRAPVGVAVSVVEGSGAAVINNNIISGASRGAIVAMHWAEEASGDLARSGAEAYPRLMIERNAIT
jgi:uncharacterized secreted repeat protein (TIGR03808 family)